MSCRQPREQKSETPKVRAVSEGSTLVMRAINTNAVPGDALTPVQNMERRNPPCLEGPLFWCSMLICRGLHGYVGLSLGQGSPNKLVVSFSGTQISATQYIVMVLLVLLTTNPI